LEREPISRVEEFKVDVHGTFHRGQRVVLIVSETEVRQELRYKGLRRVDPDVYALRDSDFMRAIASEIMWRLVAQWKAERARTTQPRASGPGTA
jgi:hypothetical protein